MALKNLLMAALLGVAVSDNCLLYSCTSLGSTVCAQKYDTDTIYITSDGCDCTVTISLLDLLAYYDNGATIECSTSDDSNPTYNSNFSCGTRDSNVELVSGIYPKMCNDSTDCLLENGFYNACYCAYDGKSYCVPDMSSSVYDDYWTGCENDDLTEVEYGNYYYSIYPFQVNSPSCAADVIYELITLSNLDVGRKSDSEDNGDTSLSYEDSEDSEDSDSSASTTDIIIGVITTVVGIALFVIV
jgi:hypothetical protein